MLATSFQLIWTAVASEAVEEYLKASTFRFEEPEKQTDARQVALF